MSIPEIIEAAAAHYGIPAKSVTTGGCHSMLRRRARNLAIRLLNRVCDLSPYAISESVAADRKTVRSALREKVTQAREKFEQPVWQSVLATICTTPPNPPPGVAIGSK